MEHGHEIHATRLMRALQGLIISRGDSTIRARYVRFRRASRQPLCPPRRPWTGRTAIETINRCISKRVCDLVLNQPDSNTRRTWFVLDEVSEAGKLDGLVSIMKRGRSKGAAAVLAFQSVSGLRNPTLYGPYLADEILGQVGNRFFGRIECVATAEWASSLFADQEREGMTYTESTSGSSRTRQQVVTPAGFAGRTHVDRGVQ